MLSNAHSSTSYCESFSTPSRPLPPVSVHVLGFQAAVDTLCVELEDDMISCLSAPELEVHDTVHTHLPHVLQTLCADMLAKLHTEAGRHVRLCVGESDVSSECTKQNNYRAGCTVCL